MNIPGISGISPVTQGSPPPVRMPIMPVNTLPQLPNLAIRMDGTNEAVNFDSFFEAYMDMVSSAAQMEATSEQISTDYALGLHDDMLAVVLAQEMAYTSMYFTVQVTSRIIEAYREIMRMQI